MYWIGKSRIQWTKERDCNSQFFHKVANGKRNEKFIKFLVSKKGEILNNVENIFTEIVNFFGKLYSKPLSVSWRLEGLDQSPIAAKSAMWFDHPFSEEKVHNVVFQLDEEKASRLDGFSIVVFQKCWDVIKEDLPRVFSEFHSSGVINQSTNATSIALMPKKRQTNKISDFKPRNLVKSLYKIIFKVLLGQIQGVLHETIHVS